MFLRQYYEVIGGHTLQYHGSDEAGQEKAIALWSQISSGIL